ncbi:serine protease inhibitor [Paenibacillus sp. J31TS4]|uniref:serpin family protein n=1 Tax=Paenibacillus sp. J31TS4 TaxID=2807195 RepID=UPI001B25A628|nr:serpin family protein [Paenibacillus sp. J31TS4]GIP36980.1 serine protease inhibitor [Paenibacillus sp. J31TS4]
MEEAGERMKKQMKKRLLAGGVLLAVIGIAGGWLLAGNKGEANAPVYTIEDLDRRIVSGGNEFGLALFQKASQAEGKANVFLSPVSISMALAMAWNGAAEEDREAMAAALRLQGLSALEINRGNAVLQDLLEHRDQVRLSIANAVWTDKRYKLSRPFQDLVRADYQGEARTADLSSERTVKEINKWVSKHTDQAIDRILEEAPGKEALALLLNAVSFEAGWETPFKEAQTREAQFFPETGTAYPLPMMNRTGSMEFKQTDRYTALRLPYRDGDMAMRLVLPPIGQPLAGLLADLDELEKEWRLPYERAQIELTLPKFKLTFAKELKPMLAELGLAPQFQADRARFRAMLPDVQTSALSSVFHKSYLEVSEKGTKAAAVTSLLMAGSAPSSPPTPVKLDRPFLLIIEDRKTEALLFIGAIYQPEPSAS